MRAILGIVAMILAVASSLGYWGPFRWLSEAQLSLFGIYHSVLTFIAVLLILVLPAAWLGGWLDTRIGAETREKTRAWTDPLARLVDRAALMPSLLRMQRWLGLLVIGVILVTIGFGWTLYAESRTVAPPEKVDVADVLSGKNKVDGYVQLINFIVLPQPAYSFVVKARAFGSDAGKDTTYLPVVAKGPQPEGKVVLFVAISTKESGVLPTKEIVGKLERDGLPGPIRARAQAQLLAGREHYVIRAGRTHTDDMSWGIPIMVIGVFSLAAGVATGASATVSKYRRRRE